MTYQKGHQFAVRPQQSSAPTQPKGFIGGTGIATTHPELQALARGIYPGPVRNVDDVIQASLDKTNKMLKSGNNF